MVFKAECCVDTSLVGMHYKIKQHWQGNGPDDPTRFICSRQRFPKMAKGSDD